jgi:hypothetical protein
MFHFLGFGFPFEAEGGEEEKQKMKSARTSELNGTFIHCIYCSQLKWTSIMKFYCGEIVRYFYVCYCVILRWNFGGGLARGISVSLKIFARGET